MKKKEEKLNHFEWLGRMYTCFNFMLHAFSLKELEEIIEKRKKEVPPLPHRPLEKP